MTGFPCLCIEDKKTYHKGLSWRPSGRIQENQTYVHTFHKYLLNIHRIWQKSSANGRSHPLSSFPSYTTSTQTTCKKLLSFKKRVFTFFRGGYQLPICQFFPFPSVSCVCPAPPHLKFWDSKDNTGLNSVVSLLPWFLPCIVPISFVGIFFAFNFFMTTLFTYN